MSSVDVPLSQTHQRTCLSYQINHDHGLLSPSSSPSDARATQRNALERYERRGRPEGGAPRALSFPYSVIGLALTRRPPAPARFILESRFLCLLGLVDWWGAPPKSNIFATRPSPSTSSHLSFCNHISESSYTYHQALLLLGICHRFYHPRLCHNLLLWTGIRIGHAIPGHALRLHCLNDLLIVRVQRLPCNSNFSDWV